MTDHPPMSQISSKVQSPEDAMRRAIQLANAGVNANRGGPFGAIIVKDGQIIAEGENRVTSSGDPTAHAEIVAIRAACEALGTHVLEGCEIYSSCEPCPMCLAAVEWARLDRLYFGASRQDAAKAGFDDERLYQELAKPIEERQLPTEQLLAEEADGPFEIWNAKDDKTPY